MLRRRTFLKLAGFAFAGAAAGCQRAPVQEAIPPLALPEDAIPGRSLLYASTCGGCNAGCGLLVKARDGFAATGLPTVADDSGLEVAALNGMPGVLSARWAGVHGDDAGNTALLLAQLRDVPDDRRGAAFVSACALVSDSDEIVVRGEWPGTIAREPRGDGGFGYDPVFIPQGSDRTAAQLSPAQKDAVSHRGRALALLVPALRALAEPGP